MNITIFALPLFWFCVCFTDVFSTSFNCKKRKKIKEKRKDCLPDTLSRLFSPMWMPKSNPKCPSSTTVVFFFSSNWRMLKKLEVSWIRSIYLLITDHLSLHFMKYFFHIRKPLVEHHFLSRWVILQLRSEALGCVSRILPFLLGMQSRVRKQYPTSKIWYCYP